LAYQETDKTKAKKAEIRERILSSAHNMVVKGGFRAASVSAIAKEAGVATGTLYRHFPSKSELFSEVFRSATEKEVSKVADSINHEALVTERLKSAVYGFSRRALKSPQLAWALIAEPVDPLVDADRLLYRQAYAELFEKLLEEGIRSGELPMQSKSVSAAAIVGVMAETLVGPLSPPSRRELHDSVTPSSINEDQLIESIARFCVQAVTSKEYI